MNPSQQELNKDLFTFYMVQMKQKQPRISMQSWITRHFNRKYCLWKSYINYYMTLWDTDNIVEVKCTEVCLREN